MTQSIVFQALNVNGDDRCPDSSVWLLLILDSLVIVDEL